MSAASAWYAVWICEKVSLSQICVISSLTAAWHPTKSAGQRDARHDHSDGAWWTAASLFGKESNGMRKTDNNENITLKKHA